MATNGEGFSESRVELEDIAGTEGAAGTGLDRAVLDAFSSVTDVARGGSSLVGADSLLLAEASVRSREQLPSAAITKTKCPGRNMRPS